jgi:hypothetical protein
MRARGILFSLMVCLSFPTAVLAAPDRAQKLKKAKQLAKKKSYRQAETLLRGLLAPGVDDPEVSFELALVLIADKKNDGALVALEPLDTSKHADAPRFRVEARLHDAFKPLRGNDTFRRIVRIDKVEGHPVTLYERLVGTGGHWEQAQRSCDTALVRLDFARAPKQGFDLVISSSCKGDTDTTRLHGTWRANEADEVLLSLPNPGGDTETLPCRMETCGEEDCLRCAKGTDMEFLVLGVRR